MPQSRSKRDTYTPPPKPRPKPSPRWVPIVGTSLIVVGLVIILVNYIFPGVVPIGNWSIVLGFVLMAAGLAVLSQWH